MLESMPARLLALDGVEQERALTTLRSQLPKSEFSAAWAEGRALTLDQAVALALQPFAPTPQADAQTLETPADASGLTARERDVLRLLAEGLSNQQIAERLVVSAFTVRAHLRAIYGKLGVTTRSAATRYALEHHLV
jgi:DNA-binding NarL/FixJ family response regulator